MWGNCNLTLSNKLQKPQNRAARILTFSSYDTDVEDLFSKLRWRKLSSQREMQKAIVVSRSLNGLTPEYLRELYVNRSDVTEYLLRDSVNKLAVPLQRQLKKRWISNAILKSIKTKQKNVKNSFLESRPSKSKLTSLIRSKKWLN